MPTSADRIGRAVVVVAMLAGAAAVAAAADPPGHWYLVDTFRDGPTRPPDPVIVGWQVTISDNAIAVYRKLQHPEEGPSSYSFSCTWTWRTPHGMDVLVPGETIAARLSLEDRSVPEEVSGWRHGASGGAGSIRLTVGEARYPWSTAAGSARDVVNASVGLGEATSQDGTITVPAGPPQGSGTIAIRAACGAAFERIYEWRAGPVAATPTPSPAPASKPAPAPTPRATPTPDLRAEAKRALETWLSQYSGACLSQASSLGSEVLYDAAVDTSGWEIDAGLSASALYEPNLVVPGRKRTGTVKLRYDPRQAREDAQDPTRPQVYPQLVKDIWHELTHAIEDGHGDVGVFQNEVRRERNITYMLAVVEALDVLQQAEARSLKRDSTGVADLLRRGLDGLAKARAALEAAGGSVTQIKTWNGFTVDVDKLKLLYETGCAGAALQDAVRRLPTPDYEGGEIGIGHDGGLEPPAEPYLPSERFREAPARARWSRGESTWDTPWGPVTLRVEGNRVSGGYPHDGGRISGVVSMDGATLVGTWSEAPSFAPPEDGGALIFELGADGASFSGLYWYGPRPADGSGGRAWNGTRRDAPRAASAVPPSNVARGRRASQSSTDYGGEPGRAVDGASDGAYAGGSVTHTRREAQPWWQVDLGAVFDVDRVVLFNRTDCCAERLADVVVLVSETPIPEGRLAAALADPRVASFRLPGPAPRRSEIPVHRRGRHVRVQLAGSDYLSLAEVEVLATPAP